MVIIDTSELYGRLVNQYNRKGSWTNNYLLSEVTDLILHDRLLAVCGEYNAVFLVRKEGFMRLYYYINNFEEALSLPRGEYVAEILFRGENAPEPEIQWLEGMGFRKNLIRDQYFAKYSSLAPPVSARGLKIDLTRSEEDALWAINLFNSSFDKWSGDFIPEEVASELIQKQAILMAMDENDDRLGALHLGSEKGVTWLHHVAVVKTARGMGVGRGLLDAFIEQGHVDDNSRYMLWVQRQNTPALVLYKKKGFSPMNKSALSMIKL